MHSLEPELRQLHSDGVLDDPSLQRAVLLERGSVFSVFLEMRIALFVAVAMIIAGVGLFLRDHLQRIGPLSIVIGLLLIALGCYASAIRTQPRQQPRSVSGDYVLVLGALVFSTAMGYAEAQYHLLGQHWSGHLLLLAVWHALTAYGLRSPLVLAVALTSLAAWFGIEPSVNQWFDWDGGTLISGTAAFSCAAVMCAWFWLHQRAGSEPSLLSVLEHFAINTAFWGALAYSFTLGQRWLGLFAALGLAAFVIPRGLRHRAEGQVVYGVGYATLAACVVIGEAAGSGLLATITVLVLIVTAAVLLWRWHRQLKQPA